MLPFTERTLVILKPDAVKRALVGEILSRFERAGLTIIAMKLVRPTIEHARTHYPTTEAQLRQMGGKTLATYAELKLDAKKQLGTDDALAIGKMIHEWNAEFLSSGPVVVCVLEGLHAVGKVRAICGKTMPKDAAPGSIRGDYSSASPAVSNVLQAAVYNLLHASDNELDKDEPAKEIRHWFKPEELNDYANIHRDAMFPTPRASDD